MVFDTDIFNIENYTWQECVTMENHFFGVSLEVQKIAFILLEPGPVQHASFHGAGDPNQGYEGEVIPARCTMDNEGTRLLSG